MAAPLSVGAAAPEVLACSAALLLEAGWAGSGAAEPFAAELLNTARPPAASPDLPLPLEAVGAAERSASVCCAWAPTAPGARTR